ncbi:MAG TPA: hypothetical protein VHN18_17835 [Micromonosporaceae bacterium]|nr:hypothetical protein [Micromonosporaceae bacterium]
MPTARIRLCALALATAGVLFVLYPATRPWTDESTAEGALTAMSSPAWVASHLFAIIGFVLVPLGLLGVHAVLSRTRAERLAAAAVVAAWIGAGLTLPYYGAEDFCLHGIASEAVAGQPVDLLAVADAVRFHPVAATTFLLGLLVLAVGAVLTAIAVWRSPVLPRPSALAFALGFTLFIPQFFTPAAVRIGHGVLVGVGCVLLALALWRTTDSADQAGPVDIAARPGQG